MKDNKNTKPHNGLLSNEAIRFPQVQLIDADGANVGVVSRDQALIQARDSGLDLVLLAESGAMGCPVVKILDLGKELYDRKKKQNEAKKHQKIIQIKEIKLRPKIGEHDYQIKLNQGIGFLEDGKKLKITLVFRKGREMVVKDDRGNQMFEKIKNTFKEHGILDRIMEEKEFDMGGKWSRIYFLKHK